MRGEVKDCFLAELGNVQITVRDDQFIRFSVRLRDDLAAGMPVFALVTTHTREDVSRATAVFDGFEQIELGNLAP